MFHLLLYHLFEALSVSVFLSSLIPRLQVSLSYSVASSVTFILILTAAESFVSQTSTDAFCDWADDIQLITLDIKYVI